ncbi:LysR substrate-binding domain-containing protein [Curvibacter sp. RS43]|uniref:LysR family transcriptional regulator n=1 Tax=Curvibacter microcysteis TaxID=3026419 RepID=UPI002362A2EA|nr:LysR substrate-binding domain-containing protein [Curvibacter sp. RS43]MDD0812248.1 LysR substrate-binding domain-containing protein [Curvibacter sp. RS43]
MNILASLRYLVSLSEHQHFGRAAQACHITQPALSNALRALESEFGVVIVKRTRQYAGLTAEGERVLVTARRMLREHELLQQDLESEADRPRGTLRIGAVPTAMPIVARFAARLQALYPGIRPVVLSLSSPEIENGLEALSLDLGLGYTDRLGRNPAVQALPQYTEHYFLVRRSPLRPPPGTLGLQRGQAISWLAAAELPLCLLTPDMHNRTIVDSAFALAGAEVKPVIETNSILTLSLSVVAGEVCAVLPGALVGAARGYGELEALPLISPEVQTPIGFMLTQAERPSRALEAALALARQPSWLAHAAQHSGAPAAGA